jgi:hypothetical protein
MQLQLLLLVLGYLAPNPFDPCCCWCWGILQHIMLINGACFSGVVFADCQDMLLLLLVLVYTADWQAMLLCCSGQDCANGVQASLGFNHGPLRAEVHQRCMRT